MINNNESMVLSYKKKYIPSFLTINFSISQFHFKILKHISIPKLVLFSIGKRESAYNFHIA